MIRLNLTDRYFSCNLTDFIKIYGKKFWRFPFKCLVKHRSSSPLFFKYVGVVVFRFCVNKDQVRLVYIGK